MRKKVLMIGMVLVLAASMMWAAGVPESGTEPKKLEKVDFLLNWTIAGDHSPYYVAQKFGWFAEEGLDVNIIVGQGSGYSVQAVDSGKADIAISDAPVPITSREKGANVKIIGIIFDKHPNCSYFWKDSGIKVPQDLAGKTVAVPATDGHKVMWPAFAKQIGVDPNSVKFVNIDPAAKVSMWSLSFSPESRSWRRRFLLINWDISSGRTTVSMRTRTPISPVTRPSRSGRSF